MLSERDARLERLAALRALGRDPFQITRYERTHEAREVVAGFAELEGKRVRVAGRAMARRGQGGATFIDLHDASGRVQVYAALDSLGEVEYGHTRLVDVGDFVGAVGEVFRTRRGEVSVRAEELVVLAKALRPLPEKWHGLTDTESRFRHRHLDLIMNPDVRELFVARSRMVGAVREMLVGRGFLEVETPMMQVVPGGATAHPFVTHHRALDMDLYLRVAPELFLKRLIVGGFERVFEINRNFRNEGMDRDHNPEFTMLELYLAYADYEAIMAITEDIVGVAAQAVCGSLRIESEGHEIDLAPPWRRVTVRDALLEYANVEWSQLCDDESAARLANERNLSIGGRPDAANVVKKLVDEYVEPHLTQPTHLTEMPVSISPLAKRKPSEPELTERFETFVCGHELANAFSELNDPLDQRERFEKQAADRAAGDEEAHPMDEDFLVALEHGMPPTGGLGIGIDRLLMLLADRPAIREVILFPLMRPE
jgi:lysyl-tRNA synthetase class 2